MIAYQNEEGKEFNIKRRNTNKTEMNLMDFQYDKYEWRQINFRDKDDAQNYMFYFISKKNLPSFNEIIQGLISAYENGNEYVIS